MKKECSSFSNKTDTEKTLNRLTMTKNAPTIGFFILLGLYIVAIILIQRSSSSEEVFILMGQPVPIRSLPGVFSCVANLCIIFLVVFYKKTGFYIAMALLLIQFPKLVYDLAIAQHFASLAGFFTNLLTILEIVLLYRYTTSIKRYQVRLRNQAVTDRMTGLPNRFACSELIEDLVKRNEKFACAVLHLNNFRNIANTMGPNTGNAVLAEVVRRWKKIADDDLSGTRDFLTCQQEDEFTLIIREYISEEVIPESLACYLEALKTSITVDESDFYLTVSIGYAQFPDDAKNIDDILTCAHAALEKARTLNTTVQIASFRPEFLEEEHLVETEQKIRSALDNNLLVYELQPQYDISHRLSGFEVLARIKDADGTVVSPGEFIPVAEKVGLIDKIDYRVFRDSAIFFGDLIRKTNTDIRLCVNVSVRHLMKNDFLEEVRDVLKVSGIPANQLEIEITESIMINSMEKALQCINEIKKMGVRIAIDDFGTGYSSLSYLNSFPADMLKVDKSFIDKMNQNDASKKYVAAIISIGHVMNFDVISEGVEEPEQLETLREIGCDYVQGFIWGRPMPPEAAEKLVMESVLAG